MMTTLCLTCDPQSINYFSACYLQTYKNDFNGLVNVVNMWRANMYAVYAMMDGGISLGVSHGWYRGTDFYGHLYFHPEHRGKKAKEAVVMVSNRIMDDYQIDEVCSQVPKENKLARHFLTSVGFTKDKDKFTYKRR